MTADIMFEDLGYKMYEYEGVGCTYYKPKRRIHFFYADPRGTVENGNGYVVPNKREKEAIKQKLKEIKCSK
jgi:hypothetical protein